MCLPSLGFAVIGAYLWLRAWRINLVQHGFGCANARVACLREVISRPVVHTARGPQGIGFSILCSNPDSVVGVLPQAEKEKAGIVDEVEGDNCGAALSMSRSSAFGSITRSSMAAK